MLRFHSLPVKFSWLTSSPDTMCIIKQDTLSAGILVQFTNLVTLPQIAMRCNLQRLQWLNVPHGRKHFAVVSPTCFTTLVT